MARRPYEYDPRDVRYVVRVSNMITSNGALDPLVVRHENDPVAIAGSRYSNALRILNGGAIQSQGVDPQAPQGYGIAVSSTQDRRVRATTIPQANYPGHIFGASQLIRVPMYDHALHALLDAGVTAFSVTADTNQRVRNVHEPLFLHGVKFDPANGQEWFTKVLPHIETLEFVINSTVDLHFAHEMLQSPHLPFLYEAITKVNLPYHHWSSSTVKNGPCNAYFKVMTMLPNLGSIALTMHNGGFTDSCYGESQMLNIERVDSLRSRARKVLPLHIVVAKYGFEELFKCRGLRRLRLEYVECARTDYFTVVGSASRLLGQLQAFFNAGFTRGGMRVMVEVVKIERE